MSLYRFCFSFSTVIRPINFLQPRSLSLVQRHIVLRRAQSVGMPRHALRRRMPNTAGLRPRSPARCRDFYSFREDARCWGGSRARSGVCGFPTLESAPAGNDLENYPYDLAEILHVAPNGHCKNKSLLAFCWEKSKCWSKMRFSDEIFDFFYFDSQNLATRSR